MKPLAKDMKREIDIRALVFAFTMIPGIILMLSVFLIPNWTDHVLIAVGPFIFLTNWAIEATPCIHRTFGDATSIVGLGLGSLQFLIYALVVASGLRRDRLASTILLLGILHAVAVVSSAGIFLSQRYYTPLEGMMAF